MINSLLFKLFLIICSVDCGVFVIKFMELRRFGAQLIDEFSQVDIRNIRDPSSAVSFSFFGCDSVSNVTLFVWSFWFLCFLFGLCTCLYVTRFGLLCRSVLDRCQFMFCLLSFECFKLISYIVGID